MAMKTNQTPISTHQWQCANHRLARKPENTVKNCEDLWNHETKCQVLCFSIFAVSNPMLRMKMNLTVGKVQLRTFSSGSKLTRLVKYSRPYISPAAAEEMCMNLDTNCH